MKSVMQPPSARRPARQIERAYARRQLNARTRALDNDGRADAFNSHRDARASALHDDRAFGAATIRHDARLNGPRLFGRPQHERANFIALNAHEARSDLHLSFDIVCKALRSGDRFLDRRGALLDANRRQGLWVDRPLLLSALHGEKGFLPV
jgi:hypothetical protein